jgi:hypothetical protein
LECEKARGMHFPRKAEGDELNRMDFGISGALSRRSTVFVLLFYMKKKPNEVEN